MTNARRTSHRRSQVQHRPAHWNPREAKEAFAFWLGFEALLNLLNRCGLELFSWLRDAMEHELIPGLLVASVLFLVYTPASRYALLLAAAKSHGYQFGQTILKLRVEQILHHILGHHMRTVLLWVAGTACIHLTVGCAKSAFLLTPDVPIVRALVSNVLQRKSPPPTPFNAANPAALATSNDR